MKSYLEQRRQTVKVNDQMSNELPVLSGVPEESLLGRLFFLVYMNDSPDVITSTNFGYADDFKVIGENLITLSNDVRRVYKWCSNIFMSMILAKSKYVAIKGCATVSLTNCTFEKAEILKDLGVLYSENLSWSPHAKKRAETAIKALYTLKRNMSKATPVNRKNAYVSYVVPIVSYASVLWMPNKGDVRVIEHVEQKAVAWILGQNSLTYREKLVTLYILPLSLYQELHVILLLAKIMNGNIDIDWTKYMSMLDYGGTRNSQTRNFAAKPMRFKKCKSDFWFRACQLANVFNDFFKKDFLLNPNYKNNLLRVYKAFLRQIYSKTKPCTWRFLSVCSTCEETKKLKKLELPRH